MRLYIERPVSSVLEISAGPRGCLSRPSGQPVESSMESSTERPGAAGTRGIRPRPHSASLGRLLLTFEGEGAPHRLLPVER